MARIKMKDRAVRALKAPTSGQIDYFDEKLAGFGLRITSHDLRRTAASHMTGMLPDYCACC